MYIHVYIYTYMYTCIQVSVYPFLKQLLHMHAFYSLIQEIGSFRSVPQIPDSPLVIWNLRNGTERPIYLILTVNTVNLVDSFTF